MSAEFRIFHGLDAAAGRFAPSALTIGNFDGVHLGHRELYKRLEGWKRQLGAKPSALTFDPHPAKVLAPSRAPRLLSTLSQRTAWMRECGVEQVLVVPFTLEFSHLSPREFVEQVVVKTAGAKAVLVGENFRFGSKQAGDTELLHQLGREQGFATEIVSGVSYRGAVVSSTRIRQLLDEGNVQRAARMLGRPYSIGGEVVSGHGIGSKQTVPTLNLKTGAEVIPLRGVYVTEVRDADSGRAWPAVSNVGFRPTFGGDDSLSIESFLLDGYSAPSPKRIAVAFLYRLREERKFASPEGLKAQILKDAGRALRFHRAVKRLGWTMASLPA